MSPALLKSQPDIYFNPFTVMESSHIGPTLFSEYLFQNALHFFKDVDDLSSLEDRYSRTQAIQEDIPYSYYNAQEIELVKGVLAISRSIGVMHDNIHSYAQESKEEELPSQGRKRAGLFQLTKPKFSAMRQERKINQMSLYELQKDVSNRYGMHHSLSQLATDLLPFCNMFSPQYRRLAQFQQEEANGLRNQYVANAVEDLGIHSDDESYRIGGAIGGGVIKRRKLSEIKEEELSQLYSEVEDSQDQEEQRRRRKEEELEDEQLLTLQDLRLIDSED